MKKFTHQQFIQDNQIEIQALPNMLQKRIRGFEELEEDLQHTTEEDREKLLDRMELLSHELDEDLEEYFEENIENNEEDEDELPEEVPEEKPEIIAEEKVSVPEPEPDIEPEPEPEPILKELTDEDVLEGLLAEKKHIIQPTELKAKGYKGQLGEKTLMVGKFCLLKGKYDTCYKIILKGK